MVKIAQKVLENPVKLAVSAISAASVIVGSVLYIDDRYAHASDVLTEVGSLKNQQKQIIQQERLAINRLRREQLEDKVFELTLKQHPTATDKALMEHYNTQMRDLQTEETTQDMLNNTSKNQASGF